MRTSPPMRRTRRREPSTTSPSRSSSGTRASTCCTPRKLDPAGLASPLHLFREHLAAHQLHPPSGRLARLPPKLLARFRDPERISRALRSLREPCPRPPPAPHRCPPLARLQPSSPRYTCSAYWVSHGGSAFFTKRVDIEVMLLTSRCWPPRPLHY
ncbi:hypothetical protein OG21DRAFT_1498163 [Imleria badia]|nr:hypothetical protein OG21DRAFT_1498163 [Imleria badia]